MKKARTPVVVPLKLSREKVRDLTLSAEQLAQIQGGAGSHGSSNTQTSTGC